LCRMASCPLAIFEVGERSWHGKLATCPTLGLGTNENKYPSPRLDRARRGPAPLPLRCQETGRGEEDKGGGVGSAMGWEGLFWRRPKKSPVLLGRKESRKHRQGFVRDTQVQLRTGLGEIALAGQEGGRRVVRGLFWGAPQKSPPFLAPQKSQKSPPGGPDPGGQGFRLDAIRGGSQNRGLDDWHRPQWVFANLRLLGPAVCRRSPPPSATGFMVETWA
jgi:hypothetical protein